MLKGFVKSEGPRGEHVSAAFGSLIDSFRMVVWVPPTIHKKLVSHLVETTRHPGAADHLSYATDAMRPRLQAYLAALR